MTSSCQFFLSFPVLAIIIETASMHLFLGVAVTGNGSTGGLPDLRLCSGGNVHRHYWPAIPTAAHCLKVRSAEESLHCTRAICVTLRAMIRLDTPVASRFCGLMPQRQHGGHLCDAFGLFFRPTVSCHQYVLTVLVQNREFLDQLIALVLVPPSLLCLDH